MAEHGVKKKRLAGILAQIQQESGGRKKAINNWDSNAKRGTPSMGLLQMIAPTYTYYAKQGLRSVKYQRVPYANLWAALNYVKSRYGMSKFRSWSKGYNQGY
ncbi:MAG: SLT domain-containing protein [Actinomycetes bacterium]|jgi:SLT domain-containing protein